MPREPVPAGRSRTPAALIAVIAVAAIVLVVALLALRPGSQPASPGPTPSGVAAATSSASAPPSATRASEPAATASAPPATASPPTATAPASPTATRQSPAATAPASAVATPTAVVLPDTPLEAVLDEAYDSSGLAYDPGVLGGLEPGDVTARWYVDGDRWVVDYDGLDLEATGPLCPGNSILTAAGSFEHVSNAPTEPGACEGFDATIAEAPVGVRVCGDRVLYLAEIPGDAEGTLFGSIEQAASDGAVHGITSQAETSAGDPPEIDLDALGCETVPPG